MTRQGLAGEDSADWLSEEPGPLRAALAAAERSRLVDRGAWLFRPGDPPSGLWRVVDGVFEFVIAEQRRETAVARAHAGAWFGEEASLSDAPHPFGARAASAGVVAQVPLDALRDILAARPEWWPCLYRLARRNLVTQLRVRAETAALPSIQRLARRLLAMAGADGVALISKNEIGELLGLTRVTVHRLMNELADAGAVESRYRRVVVLDREALLRIAEGRDA